ncbi:MAG: multiheme c-type cytochrome [Thermodesulfobacteriota bacterium]
MKKLAITIIIFIFLTPFSLFAQRDKKENSLPLSQETSACLDCHRDFTPGIVADWQKSLHSQTAPAWAFKKGEKERRVTADKIPPALERVVVGCFECHGQNPEKHKDNFDHMGFKINTIVSPKDCATCHPREEKEFSGSKKAHAVGNLRKNPFYHVLVETIIGPKSIDNGRIVSQKPSPMTQQETCFACHGTDIKVLGIKKIETQMGKVEVPKLTNWPNQGVGRINPDGSRGTCSSCHPRHQFSIAVARKPYSCAQCHLEPDVPAWNVYKESKHGNIFFSNNAQWNFEAVPWKGGLDFQAPTCASCHNSLLVTPDGRIVAERTHDFGARLWVRLFGLIYSHPQPKHGDTSILKNKDGLPLPTSFSGEIAQKGLIDEKEQAKRKKLMAGICQQCHGTSWTNGHFAKLENTIQEVDGMIKASTLLLAEAWNQGLAEGLPQGKDPFDETIEQMWIRQWLFYGNSVKYSSAMTGAPDYATFKNGWWNLSENLHQMKDWIKLHQKRPKQNREKLK